MEKMVTKSLFVDLLTYGEFAKQTYTVKLIL